MDYAQTSLNSLWKKHKMKTPFRDRLQDPLQSKQQIILNLGPKWPKNFDMHFRRHNHSHLWNYFRFDLLPTDLSSFNTTGLPSFPDLTWILFLLKKRHNLLNSATQCPVSQPMQLLTKFLSWNNHPAPSIHHY